MNPFWEKYEKVMMSDQTLMSLHQLEGSFAEDNLLAAEDWDSFGCPPWNSVYSDSVMETLETQVSYSESTGSSPDSSSLDGSDAWLSDINIQGATLIKEEPMSPPSLSSSTLQDMEVQGGLESHQLSYLGSGKQECVIQRQPTQYISSPNSSDSSRMSPLKGASPHLNLSLTSQATPTTPSAVSCNTSSPVTSKVPILTIPTSNLVNLSSLKTAPFIKVENGRLLFSSTLPMTTPTNKQPAARTNQANKDIKEEPTNQPSLQRLPSCTNSVTLTTSQASVSSTSDTDIKLWKRQQRMIKNRESASLSRKKKKEDVNLKKTRASLLIDGLQKYLQSLEEKINELFSVNSQLSIENDSLKKRVLVLESENNELKLKQTPKTTSAVRKLTSVLMVVTILGLNIGTRWSLSSPLDVSSPPYLTHKSRTLLQYDANKLDSSDLGFRNIAFEADSFRNRGTLEEEIDRFKVHHLGLDKLHSSSEQHIRYLSKDTNKGQDLENSDCVTDFNKTEANRLNEALELLLERDAKAKLKMKRKLERKKKKRKRGPKSKLPVIDQHNIKTGENCSDETVAKENFTKPSLNKTVKHKLPTKYQIQLFPKFMRTLDALQKSIQRQADTFYIISFKADHLFLPATQLNDTMRPKVSLVLPTSYSNDSSSSKTQRGKFSLMQIDCQVMDTKLLKLGKGNLPPFFFDRAT